MNALDAKKKATALGLCEVAAKAGLAERTNCVLMVTSVRSGTAKVLFAQTAKGKVYGQIAGKLALRAPLTEFERGIQRFGYLLNRVMLVMVLAVLAINIFMHRPPIASLPRPVENRRECCDFSTFQF